MMAELHDAPPNDTKLNVILAEYETTSAELRLRIGSSFRVLMLGNGLIITGFGVGLSEKIDEIIIILPFALLLVLIFNAENMRLLLSLGGYRKYLEEQLCEIAGEEVIFWEKIAQGKPISRRPTEIGLGALSLIFYFVTVTFSFWKSLDYGNEVFVPIALVILIFSILLLISVFQLTKCFSEAYEQAVRIHSDGSTST